MTRKVFLTKMVFLLKVFQRFPKENVRGINFLGISFCANESVHQCCAADDGPEHDDAERIKSTPQTCTAKRLQHHSRQSIDTFHYTLASRGEMNLL